MIAPTRRLLKALAALLALGIVAAIWPMAEAGFTAAAGLVAVAALLDAAAATRAHRLAGERSVPGSLPVGVWHHIPVRIANGARRARRSRIYGHHPDGFDGRGLPQEQRAAPGQWVEIRYEVRPLERGEHRFGRIEARLDSPLGLWERTLWLGAAAVTRVYPNFAALTKYGLFATDQRLSQIGVLQRRRRGRAWIFINCANIAKAMRSGNRLEGDRAQQQADFPRVPGRARSAVVFVVDCGRRLAARDGDSRTSTTC